MEHLQDSNMSGGFYPKTSTTTTRNNNRNNNCNVGTNNNNNNSHGGGTKCGRWNPTSEQVKVLSELFRAGLRTPSTDQIQKISSELSFYGKIESKNVFYWFQNHKARERQKRRRVVSDDEFDELHVMVRKDDKISSARLLQERNNQQGSAEMEKTIETLQLFPVKSLDKSQTNKPIRELSTVIGRSDDYENATAAPGKFTYKIGSYDQVIRNEHAPPLLDLRLSFV